APGWNQNRRAQIIDTIRTHSPDVLGLHEASPNSSGRDLLADLQVDYEPHHTGTSDPIYLRRQRSFTVISDGVLALPTCPLVPGRGQVLTWIKVQTPEGQRFIFYNAHYCVSQPPNGTGDIEGNQMQAIASAEFMASNSEPGPAHLLAGDLNATQTSDTILYLLEKQPLTIGGTTFQNPVDLDDTWQMFPSNASLPRPGTGARGGPSVLDWIMTDPAADVVDAEVIRFSIPAGQEANFSDHSPVVATLQLAGDCANAIVYGCGSNPAGSLSVVSGAPAIGTTMTLGVDNPVGTQAAGSVPFLFLAFAPDTNFPCGTPMSGFGMSGPGAAGELLIGLSPPVLVVTGSPWSGPGIPALIGIAVPNDLALIGIDVFAQGLLFDASSALGVTFGVTEGIRLSVGR
ncbi:MAG: endonuclease/exonuclease/phosphatase family protein, partial [Planctomycetota bacterium]